MLRVQRDHIVARARKKCRIAGGNLHRGSSSMSGKRRPTTLMLQFETAAIAAAIPGFQALKTCMGGRQTAGQCSCS